VNPFVRLPLWPPVLVTATVTAPAVPTGVVAVIVVPFTTVTFVAAVLANVTVAPAAKSVPVIVTAVPPAIGPLFGLIPLRNGTWLTVADLNETIWSTHAPDAFRGAQE